MESYIQYFTIQYTADSRLTGITLSDCGFIESVKFSILRDYKIVEKSLSDENNESLTDNDDISDLQKKFIPDLRKFSCSENVDIEAV